jgi:hypothetical protein
MPLTHGSTSCTCSCQRHGRQRQCGDSRAQCQYTLAGGGVVNARSPRISGSDFRAGSRLETKLYVARRGGPTAPRGRRSFHSSPVKLFSRAPIPPTTHLPFLSLSDCLRPSLEASLVSDATPRVAGSRSQRAGRSERSAGDRDRS